MTTPFSNAAPSSIVRVLDFMRRADHHALLDADAEVLEAVAVHTVLSFVGYVRAAVRKKRGTCWLPRDFAFDRSCTDAVAYTVARRVVPRQLMEDGAAPLRRLLLEAVQPAAVVYVPCSGNSALRPWCEWLGQLLGVAPSDCCCTRVVLRVDGVEATAELRFQHGRFPGVAGLEQIPNSAKNGEAGAYAAALAGHLDCLRFLKDTGSNLPKGTTNGYTALHAAADREHTDCLDFLLRKLTFPPHAISGAATVALERNAIESLRVFNATGTIVVTSSQRLDGHTAATFSASQGRVESLQSLREAGVCLATSKGQHGTVAYVAAAAGQLAVLRYLHSIGVSVTAPPARSIKEFAAAPVHAAVRFGKLDCLQFLLDVEEPTVRKSDAFGALLAYAACQSRSVESLQMIVSQRCRITAPTPEGIPLVHAAVSAGAVECLGFLASNGVELDVTNASGESAAFIAVRSRLPNMLRALIKHGGAGVLSPNSRGETPLHQAAKIGAMECVPLLIAQGLLGVVDHLGRTAEEAASESRKTECCKLLNMARVKPDEYRSVVATRRGHHLRDD